MHDELEITDELYTQRAHRVRRREGVKFNRNNTPGTIAAKFLDYKEKEEVMQRRYKLKDTTYSVREHFCIETVEKKKVKKYRIRLKSCEKMESKQLLDPDDNFF